MEFEKLNSYLILKNPQSLPSPTDCGYCLNCQENEWRWKTGLAMYEFMPQLPCLSRLRGNPQSDESVCEPYDSPNVVNDSPKVGGLEPLEPLDPGLEKYIREKDRTKKMKKRIGVGKKR